MEPIPEEVVEETWQEVAGFAPRQQHKEMGKDQGVKSPFVRLTLPLKDQGVKSPFVRLTLPLIEPSKSQTET